MASILVEIDEHNVEVDLDASLVVKQLSPTAYHVMKGERSFVIGVEPVDGSSYRVTLAGRETVAHVRTAKDRLLDRYGVAASASTGGASVKAPMPGLVLRVLVGEGDVVERGQGLVVLEAMKMENELSSPVDGRIQAVHAAVGDAVGKNTPLIEIAGDS